jgi:hypothetical protein
VRLDALALKVSRDFPRSVSLGEGLSMKPQSSIVSWSTGVQRLLDEFSEHYAEIVSIRFFNPWQNGIGCW